MLTVENVSIAYGAIRAVHDVSLEVEEGEIVALLGPNGAGKTTLLSAIIGLVPAVHGRVAFEGDDITRSSPEQIVRRGVTLTPEGRHVFGDLAVKDNLRLGAAIRRPDASLDDDREMVLELFPVLRTKWEIPAGRLSGGEQQMLAIARSLMSGPRLLMLDEPSLGLAPVIVDQIFALVGDLRGRGHTILLVEQNAHRALEVADRAYVINTGRLEFSGTADELGSADELMRAYLGAGVGA